ncbi:MAG: hypothetical protein A2275_04780 [Bacteroidetes bacterium RIFOXYA12_FULL_35_11]|nr:MAG: hypothetical protein A2X01_13985 [Bacteroidetes bacterium GWF2_35_48]OFY73991.1 MAG: hypothetical protein A2275_04780 [Bacteroidetes bacterium RIFOXYA12_FULL_35_11]OFZ00096.1 MAG: hypothetical protein A2491_19335 [Bacteroidetes bacterium RIFOXYC12_FULL_35_7]HBX52112.1 hypothetical protein [Bacteroidales bacterium]
MKNIALIIIVLTLSGKIFSQNQEKDWNKPELNTAANEAYLKKEEKEMLKEINMVRSNPKRFVQYIQALLDDAKKKLDSYGKGYKHYSLTYRTTTVNGKEINTVDTTWHYANEEEYKALKSLADTLKKMKALSILKPDKGIYQAAKSFGLDNDKHKWELLHTGSDGSDPWDRICKYSPKMEFGNENIAGKGSSNASVVPTPREIVIQLLIDSGIPGYGHRWNMLDPRWTHAACYSGGYKEGMHRWIQNFGVEKK